MLHKRGYFYYIDSMEKNGIESETALKELCSALAATNDSELIERFLRSLLTEYEIDEVTKRWALVRLINDGMSQRNIAKELGLSLCKITRGSRELKKDDSAFKKMIMLYREQDKF